MQVTYYHNPRCSKSREALALLNDIGISPEVVLYLENPLSAGELKSLLTKLGISARKLLRTAEDEYHALNLADPTLSEEALIQAMVDHPRLMERPIAVAGQKAAIGRPPEAVLSLL